MAVDVLLSSYSVLRGISISGDGVVRITMQKRADPESLIQIKQKITLFTADHYNLKIKLINRTSETYTRSIQRCMPPFLTYTKAAVIIWQSFAVFC
ncbi:MAG: hypothetical protein DLM72_19650 [Candidatus Nitrosopolaris wilkensis]|nr:MAG: hypothetical protein DLM72_19650 [Candidatus Nitrosopolaris wilkensis]